VIPDPNDVLLFTSLLSRGVGCHVSLTSSYQRHDFQAIAFAEHALVVLPSGHDFQVHFDGNVARFHAQLRQQRSERNAVFNLACFAIYENSHCKISKPPENPAAFG
jgi:hypothetical protein